MDNSDLTEIESLLEKDEHELFALILPDHLKTTLYDKNGRAEKGRQIFRRLSRTIAEAICPSRAYTGDIITIAAGITESLLPITRSHNLPVTPLVALLLKIGIEKFCLENGHD